MPHQGGYVRNLLITIISRGDIYPTVVKRRPFINASFQMRGQWYLEDVPFTLIDTTEIRTM